MGKILKPGEGGSYDPKALVSQYELAALREEMREIYDDIGRNQQLLSVKIEALIKMSSYAHEKLWEPDGKGRFKMNLANFYIYFDKMLKTYVPLQEVIADSPSIMERVDKAMRWNHGSPDMPMTADELNFAEIVLQPGMRKPTQEETDAVLALPQTEIYKLHWQAILDTKDRQASA